MTAELKTSHKYVRKIGTNASSFDKMLEYVLENTSGIPHKECEDHIAIDYQQVPKHEESYVNLKENLEGVKVQEAIIELQESPMQKMFCC